MQKFSQEGATVSAGCVWHVEMMMSHRVHRRTQTHTDRTTNLIISSNVYFVPLAEIMIDWMINLLIGLIDICAACDRSIPLGMISGDIKDWQLSASSTLQSSTTDTQHYRRPRGRCHERYGRLYQSSGHAWCAKYKTASEWLQIDLGVAAKVPTAGCL